MVHLQNPAFFLVTVLRRATLVYQSPICSLFLSLLQCVVLSALDFGGTSEALLNFTLSMFLEYDFEQVNQLLCD